jgi:hypothetical protein
MSNDKDIKKKLKDVNTYSIDELKELLGLSTEDDAYTVDGVENHFYILSNKYPKLAKDGFLAKAKKRILDDIDMNPDAEPQTNKEPKEIFHWINKNENLTIGSDYDKKEGIKGKQIELFEKLYNDNKVNVLVQNFKRVVKNGLRNVNITEKERFNILNNTIQAVYMIKTITIKN